MINMPKLARLPRPSHNIQATIYEREDGMAILYCARLNHVFWLVRAPVHGQSQFWNGRQWVVNSLITHVLPGIWPADFRFEKEEALTLLDTLQAP